ncbi:MFS general substrate transporter [Aspergillus sclerotioniger CBS 115572]|uniref:MFS general substrate transporter n=1 Tax=Aspergillus sclerotioniger CBS 115572 TaxID=1450535 RepID=A0A317VNW8_9EURO|nr:MFS general substrate transporter [Aspergillus sclerotioniger CBS 115572]PWY76043.1 MFS general substrate transporter [Aspergillus sclerotioniger CBS 115572]
MLTFLRDVPLGHLIQLLSGRKLLRFPEEQDGFTVPDTFLSSARTPTVSNADASPAALESARSSPPVTWYGVNDPENPKNWSSRKKAMVYIIICFYTATGQASVSIFTPSQMLLPEIFGVSKTVSSLGLGLFVFGYGSGGLFLSPLSEIPAVGRNPPYVVSIVLFTLLSIGAPFVNTVAGITIMRLLQGWMSSAIMNTGGASLADITTTYELPYGMYSWAMFAFVGPAIGPIISGFAVGPEGWRFPLWEIVILAVPTLILVLLLPETSAPRILYARSRRLRRVTHDPSLLSHYEIERQEKTGEEGLSVAAIVYSSLIMPWKINALDPSILFTTLYCCLVYSAYYLFFEVFPLVYMDQHGMTVGRMGLIYICVPVGTLLAAIPYFAFIHWKVHAPMRAAKPGQLPPEPEDRLVPALGASIVIPAGLFLFAWTGRSSNIHWIVPTIGAMLVSGGNAIIFQSIYVYIALAYPRYAASLFGGNGFAKATVACVAVLIANFLYGRLGIAGGTSLIGGLCVLCTLGMFSLYRFGAALRARSRFTSKS